jgi:hypothetical protein
MEIDISAVPAESRAELYFNRVQRTLSKVQKRSACRTLAARLWK